MDDASSDRPRGEGAFGELSGQKITDPPNQLGLHCAIRSGYDDRLRIYKANTINDAIEQHIKEFPDDRITRVEGPFMVGPPGSVAIFMWNGNAYWWELPYPAEKNWKRVKRVLDKLTPVKGRFPD